MRKILPVLLAIIGLLGGGAAGYFLRPAPGADHPPEGEAEAHPPAEEDAAPPEYVKLNNQFIVPLLEGGHITSMVILALSIEVKAGTADTVYSREPKIRDAFLQVLFDHANTGGFRGSFTDAANLVFLRKALTETAVGVVGDSVTDVLITDIARQDS